MVAMVHSARSRWLRGTLTDVEPVQCRGVLHALELAKEDIERWCGSLTDAQLHARPAGVPSIAFHLRHIARSVDRLLTYAEDKQLGSAQRSALESELDAVATAQELFSEFEMEAALAARPRPRIRALAPGVPLESEGPTGGTKSDFRRLWQGCWFISPSIRSGTWARPLQRRNWCERRTGRRNFPADARREERCAAGSNSGPWRIRGSRLPRRFRRTAPLRSSPRARLAVDAVPPVTISWIMSK